MKLRAAVKENGGKSPKAKAAMRDFRKAVVSQASSHALFTFMTLVSAAILHKMTRYRDDDDEVTAQSVALEFMKQFGENYFKAIIPVAGDYIISAYEKIFEKSSFDPISDPIVDKANNLVDDISKLVNTPSLASVEKVAYEIASFFGIPLSNAKNIIKGLKQNIDDAINGNMFSFESGVDRKDAQEASRAYKRYLFGDKAGAADVISGWLESAKETIKASAEKDGNMLSAADLESKARSKMRSALKKQVSEDYVDAKDAGDSAKAKQIQEFLLKTGAWESDELLKQELGEWVIDRRYDGHTVSDYIKSAYAAFESGDNKLHKQMITYAMSRKADEIKNKYAAKNVKISKAEAEKEAKASIRTSMTSRFKESYVTLVRIGNMSEANELRKFLYSTGAYDSLSHLDKILSGWLK